MKKLGLVAAGALILSSNAFASKARMTSLGQDSARGSFYLSDTRGVFLNPANVVDTNNYAILEAGNTTYTTSDADAEGGYFRAGKRFSYGAYFGSDVNSQNIQRNGTGYASSSTSLQAAAFSNALVQKTDNLDVFIGSDMGMKWGARLSYAQGKSSSGGIERDQQSMGAAFGMIHNNMSAYANFDISDKSEGADVAGDKWEADLGMKIGAAYRPNNTCTWFVDYESKGGELTDAGVKGTTERTVIQVGHGYLKEISNSARVNVDVSYLNQKDEDKLTNTTKVEKSQLPVVIGIEADATDWLTLRGSLKQNIGLDTTETTTSTGKTEVDGASSVVAIGLTLNYGKLQFDGTLTGTNSTGNQLRLDQLASNVAVHYWF